MKKIGKKRTLLFNAERGKEGKGRRAPSFFKGERKKGKGRGSRLFPASIPLIMEYRRLKPRRFLFESSEWMLFMPSSPSFLIEKEKKREGKEE